MNWPLARLAFFLASWCGFSALTGGAEPAARWEPRHLTTIGKDRSFAHVISFDANSVVLCGTKKSTYAPSELLDPITGKTRSELAPESKEWHPAFSRDNTVLLLTSRSHNHVQGWDVKTGKALGEPILLSRDKRHIVWGSDHVPGTKLLLALDEEGRNAIRWDLVTGTRVGEAIALPEPADRLFCRPDGKTFFTFSEKTGKLYVLQLENGKPTIAPLRFPQESFVVAHSTTSTYAGPGTYSALSEDGRMLFASVPHPTRKGRFVTRPVDLDTGKQYSLPQTYVVGFGTRDGFVGAFSKDGKTALGWTGTTDKGVAVLDVVKGKVLREWRLTPPKLGEKVYLSCFAMCPEGRTVAIGAWLPDRTKGMLQLFDARTALAVCDAKLYQNPPVSARFGADGKSLTVVTAGPISKIARGQTEIQAWRQVGTVTPGEKTKAKPK